LYLQLKTTPGVPTLGTTIYLLVGGCCVFWGGCCFFCFFCFLDFLLPNFIEKFLHLKDAKNKQYTPAVCFTRDVCKIWKKNYRFFM
jgi:hypothetical protein